MCQMALLGIKGLIMKSRSILKGLYHGDFYVFWSRIVLQLNLSTYSCLWNAPKNTNKKKMSSFQFLAIFQRHKRTWKSWPFFSSYNPLLSSPSVARLVITCNHSVHYSVVTFNKTATFIFGLACVKVHLGTSMKVLLKVTDIVLQPFS